MSINLDLTKECTYHQKIRDIIYEIKINYEQIRNRYIIGIKYFIID
jgi:hypothetical protein